MKYKLGLVVTLIVVIPAFTVAHLYNSFGSFFVGILLLIVSTFTGLKSTRFLLYFKNHDIAYGTYLYAFPVQQLCWMSGVHNVIIAFTISTIISITIGHYSYTRIESPWLHKKS